MAIQERNKIGFNSKQILVVGEGDFSFSLSLAKAFGPAINITATSLDIREDLGHNYDNGKANAEELERLGSIVVRGVNIHSMTSDDRLARYDIIVFRCSHAGKLPEVMTGFLESAREMMKDEDGEILMFHTTLYPFRHLKVLAEEAGLRFIKRTKFSQWALPYCSDKRRSGCNCDCNFSCGSAAVTFMFQK